ncbi:GTPase domain-containing protein [Methylomonas sp. MgM2]
MLEFIQLLKQRYQSVVAHLDDKHPQYPDYQQCIEQLLFAEAFLRKGRLINDKPHFPLQIAVIGPTQVGKSSVVNLLLNDSLAGVSPLAGYTVHPQGFMHGLPPEASDGLQHYFGRFQQLEPSSLSRGRYDCYALSGSDKQSELLPNCMVWDTPDFDSIDAADYREGLIRTIALADIIILVVSKEKYADQSVWEVMKFIECFGQPTLICLNKLAEGSEQLVVDSLREKWLKSRHDAMPAVLTMLFRKQPALPIWPENAGAAIRKLSKQVAPRKQLLKQQQFLGRYWASWVEPVVAEHQAQHHWHGLVDQCLADAQKLYRRDYLDHPHHYHTFQAALIKLLALLEIPGIAKVLSNTRRAMTWPIRRLMALGRGNQQNNPSQEVSVLNKLGEHVLIQLADKLLEKTEAVSIHEDWWRETSRLLRQYRTELLDEYQQAVAAYCNGFQQDVDAAAHRLYYKLQDQPIILNSLRATRISTDAGAMLLAIQVGGIGVQDFVITPVMLSVTSLLTESAIGSYMHKVEAELKQHQLHVVKTSLFEACLRERLYEIPLKSHSPKRFNISEAQCHEAEQTLKVKKHGLRIL